MVEPEFRLPDEAFREIVVRDLDRTLLVEAAAGTGKTTCLVRRMIALLKAGRCRTETLAAVTFTRKATAEIRSRLQAALEAAAAEASGAENSRLVEALRHAERCFVGTIHAFCARMLRERPVEARLDPSFEELDEEADRELRQEAWRLFWAERFAERFARDGDLGAGRTAASADDAAACLMILEDVGLEPRDLERAFARRVAYADVEEWPVDDVEPPSLERVATSLREQAAHIEGLQLEGRDFGKDALMPHLATIGRAIRTADLSRLPEAMKIVEGCKSRSVVQKMWPGGKAEAKAEETRWNEFVERMEPLVSHWRAFRYRGIMVVLRHAVERYERLRRERGVLNFCDLLARTRNLLRDSPATRAYFRRRFSHVLVDEFQDTDPLQAEILLLLTADDRRERDWTKCRPEPGSLFFVGDPKQSIYRFRRADMATYDRVRRTVDESGGSQVPLSANFRSGRRIVEWVNVCFESAFPPTTTDCAPAYVPLACGRRENDRTDDGEVRKLTIPPEFDTNDEAAKFEAETIATYIRRAIDGRSPILRTPDQTSRGMPPYATESDFLLIAWNRKRLETYAAALKRERLAVDVVGGRGLGSAEEVRLLHRYLSAISRPHDPIALVATLRSELFGFSDAELYAYRRAGGAFRFSVDPPEPLPAETRERFAQAFDMLRTHRSALLSKSPFAVVERLIDELGLTARAAAGEDGDLASGDLLTSLEAARGRATFAEDVVEAVGRIARGELDRNGLAARAPTPRAVRLMNLHQCKGLEAPFVFLIDPSGRWEHPVELHCDRRSSNAAGRLLVRGASKGEFGAGDVLAHPLDWDECEGEELRHAEAERTRLLYVAATRAGTRLVVSRRAADGRGKKSPWYEFEPYLEDLNELETLPSVSEAKTTETRESWPDDESRERDDRWNACLRPSYGTRGAKELGLAGSHARPASSDSDGTAWGTLVHALAEVAMKSDGADLRSVATSVATELELDERAIEEALTTIDSVARSDLWRRALAAEKRLVEVPFARCIVDESNQDRTPMIVRGVIDLAFREPDGWVLVDYKSERVGESEAERLLDYYRGQLTIYAESWETIAAESVKERGIFFTHSSQYRVL